MRVWGVPRVRERRRRARGARAGALLLTLPSPRPRARAQPYCWKNPGGHFPELLDALALLNLRDEAQRAAVKQARA